MSPKAREYWRSLEQAADDPRAREFLEREFPPGAADPPHGVSRRTMLGLLGASLSLAGLSGCRRPVEEIVPYVDAPERVIPGLPRWFATSMPTAGGALGLVVESHEGRPTKIEGNDLHPSSRGGTSAQAQAEILNLYDPDRMKSVWFGQERKSWDDFVAMWAALEPEHLADGGAGLAVVAESFSSPTLARLKRAFSERFPSARWVTHEALSDENIDHGVRMATGRDLRALHRFEAARVILALDSDFLLSEAEAVAHARGFADGRRVRGPADGMSRLWVVEGVHSLTAANADHRLPLASSRIGAFVAALAERLRAAGLSLESAGAAAPTTDLPAAWLDALTEDLLAQRGAGLIVAGRRQPPEVHAAVLALNAALGNLGRTLRYVEPVDATRPDRPALAELCQALRSDTVSTLVLIGGNPAYDAPADLDFATAAGRARTVIRLADRVDESCPADGWKIPRAHFLESWSDVRAADGTPGVVQPLIQPLFAGKSDVELLGLLATGADAPGYDRVRETWQGLLPAADFERAWFDLLHDGALRDGALPEATPTVRAGALAGLGRGAAAEGLELVFLASPALHDGRYANNGWLQELPDALSKLTWDNAALMSVETAARLGVRSEDGVRLQYDGRELELPAWVLPGMAEGTVAVALGYGRRAAGRVGNGVGVDAYVLRTSRAPDFDDGLTVAPSGRRYALASTQDHWSMEGRPLVREATLAEYREHPEFAKHAVEVPVERSMWQEHTYTSSPQWGMSIDLNACTGCNACVIACQSENNVPVVGKREVRNGREMHWIRVDRYFAGPADDPRPEVAFQPVPCMQCENAPCEQVCPVAATVHDSEGLNAMVYNRCIGTRYCSNNCPYKVRRFNFFNFTKDTPELVKLAQNPDVTVRSRGVMEKCTYCTQRIEAAKITAKLDGRPLRDGDVRTACQQACPTQAIAFGDITDVDSGVARLKSEDRDYSMLEELYTRPRTTFMARLRNPHPRLEHGG